MCGEDLNFFVVHRTDTGDLEIDGELGFRIERPLAPDLLAKMGS
jgi:hypothetical protein